MQLRLPNPFGGGPWCEASVAVVSARHADGDSLHLQARMDSCLRLPPAATAHNTAPTALPGLTRTFRKRLQRAGVGSVRQAVARFAGKQLSPLLDRRVQAWMDVRVTSLPLVQGVEGLIPEQLRALCSGLSAHRAGLPQLTTWLAQIDGPRPGWAQITALLMQAGDSATGKSRRPLSLAASLATCVREDMECCG